MNVSYSNGSVPLFTDTRYVLLMRILLAINAGGGGWDKFPFNRSG